MNKYFAVCFCLIALLASGCGQSHEESKKEEVRKNIMGPGNLPMPKKDHNIGGL